MVWGSNLFHLEDHDTALDLVWQPVKIPINEQMDPVTLICFKDFFKECMSAACLRKRLLSPQYHD
jgi:hypothetical protein